MRNNRTPHMVTVNEHGFWDDCAEAHRLASEGNRLIARDIAEGIRSLWCRVMHRLDAGQCRHSPPI
jgi:hypothetical protein